MLTINHLTIIVKGRTLIDDLNLSLHHGDKLAIIGEEGNGKSTLLKVIANLVDYAEYSGSFHLSTKHIGYLKQTLDEKDLAKDVFSYIFINEEEYYDRIADFYSILNELSLPDTILKKAMSILSGGEKVKIQLLKILLKKPDLLLLDEPTNDLDLLTLQWLEDFILHFDKPLIFISHDETLLSHCANQILHIEQRNRQNKPYHTFFQGDYLSYKNQRNQKREKEIQIAAKEKAEYKKKQQHLNDIRNAVHDALNDTVRNPKQASLLKKKMKNVKALEKRYEKEGYSKVDTLEENITLVFPKIHLPIRKEILSFHLKELYAGTTLLSKNIDFSIYGNAHIVITGSNGCGKTTLLKKIYDTMKNRNDIHVGYMPQNYDTILPTTATAIDFLVPKQDKETLTWARKYLGNMNFTSEEMVAPIHSLSGGSKAKLIFISLMMKGYDVLILDEPTRNISPLSTPVIMQALSDFGGCIISVSHDRAYIEKVGNQLYELDQKGLHLQK